MSTTATLIIQPNYSRGDDIIASSHKGPSKLLSSMVYTITVFMANRILVLVYIAPTSSNGVGPVWTKLFHAGNSAGSWAVDSLLAARGKHSIIIPNLPAGDYLLRRMFSFHLKNAIA